MASPTATGRLRGPSVAAALGLAVAFWGALLGSRTLSDNSFFTHLATGRLILAGGGVPNADPYSYTAPGAPWVVQSWLASLAYAGSERLAGPTGIRLVTALLAGAVALGAWTLTRPARSLAPRVVLTALVVVVGGAMWTSRPFMFGLAALVVALLAVEGRVPPWVLVPVFWIWVNTHGSFPIGLLAIAAFAAGRKLDGGDPRVELRALAYGAVGSVAGMAGPLGTQALTFPVALLGRGDLLQRVVEWQSPNFSQGFTRIFLLQVVIAVLVLVRRPTWRAAVPLVLFTALALYAMRNIGVAGLVLLPGMARALRGFGSVTGRERGPVAVALTAVVAVAGVFATSVVLGQRDYDLAAYPVDAYAYVRANTVVDPARCRLLTTDVGGNFLELVTDPATGGPRVFLDDRYDMYPVAVTKDYLHLHAADPEAATVLDRYEIDQVLWERQAPLSQVLSVDGGWQLRYQDDRWSVFGRRQSATACEAR